MHISIKFLSVFLLCSWLNLGAQAQDEKRWIQHGEAALAFGPGQFSGALSWSQLYGFGKSKKFKIGYGVRYTGFVGQDQDYITAPAKLTSGEEGPQVLFSETIEANLDTFKVKSPAFHSINLAIYLQYNISKKLQVGFNIDAVGFSFGKKTSGTFTSDLLPGKPTLNLEAKPTSFNALLISDNDLGSLNSELFARYFVTEKLAIRGGISFLFTEYTTTTKPVLDNDRFRNKTLMLMLGVTYRL